jgi:chaperonin GroES
MKFRPLDDRVVIRRIEGEDQTKAHIIIPDTVKERPQEGEVVTFGPGARDESGKLVPLDLAGDRVLVGKWSGTEVKLEGEASLLRAFDDNRALIERVAGDAYAWRRQNYHRVRHRISRDGNVGLHRRDVHARRRGSAPNLIGNQCSRPTKEAAR